MCFLYHQKKINFLSYEIGIQPQIIKKYNKTSYAKIYALTSGKKFRYFKDLPSSLYQASSV